VGSGTRRRPIGLDYDAAKDAEVGTNRTPQRVIRTPQLAPRTPHPCFYFFPQSKIHNQKLPPSLLIATVAEGKLKVAATVLTSKYVDTLSNFI
jgi:hypothetical protein